MINTTLLTEEMSLIDLDQTERLCKTLCHELESDHTTHTPRIVCVFAVTLHQARTNVYSCPKKILIGMDVGMVF